MSSLSSQILESIDVSSVIKDYRRQRSNRKTHVFSGNLDSFKASIYLGIKKQRSKGWSPTVAQDARITEAVSKYLANMYQIFSTPSTSKIFKYDIMLGGTPNNFKAVITGEGNIEGHIQRLRNDGGILRVSNIIKDVFGKQVGNKIAVDVGHMEGSTVADQFATAMLLKFESTGNIPKSISAYEKLKVMIKYDPLAAKLARVYVEDQFWLVNQSTTDEATVSALLQEALGEFVEREAPTLINPRINKEINNFLSIAEKAGAKVSKKLPVAKREYSTKSKTRKSQKKVTGATIDSLSDVKVDSSEAPVRNWASLISILNKKLPQQVARNMGAPGLVYRTGRFAESAQVVAVETTKDGRPSIVFDYQRDPYDVFDRVKGRQPWNTPERDPRSLVDRSVRELVQEMAIGRFYTRRA